MCASVAQASNSHDTFVCCFKAELTEHDADTVTKPPHPRSMPAAHSSTTGSVIADHASSTGADTG